MSGKLPKRCQAIGHFPAATRQNSATVRHFIPPPPKRFKNVNRCFHDTISTHAPPFLKLYHVHLFSFAACAATFLDSTRPPPKIFAPSRMTINPFSGFLAGNSWIFIRIWKYRTPYDNARKIFPKMKIKNFPGRCPPAWLPRRGVPGRCPPAWRPPAWLPRRGVPGQVSPGVASPGMASPAWISRQVSPPA